MKVLATSIKYSERTREFVITMNSLSAYKEYKDISDQFEDDEPRLSFLGNFAQDTSPSQIVVEVPYNDLFENIGEIENYVKQEIRKQTSRDVESFVLIEIK